MQDAIMQGLGMSGYGQLVTAADSSSMYLAVTD